MTTPPPYVRRGGLDVSPPPFFCDDIEAAVFYVEGDGKALQEVCDRTINAPSGGKLHYSPIVNWVALTFQTFTNLHSSTPPMETHSYSEASFWIMVANQKGPELLIPYMFIDDWVELAAGREIFGYPKEYASITIPPVAHPLLFEVRALALNSSAPRTPATQNTILRCYPRGAVGLSELGEDLWPNVVSLLDAGSPLSRMKHLIDMFLTLHLDFVFLRQLRALGGGPSADLQQVVSAAADPFTVLRLHRLLLDYELSLPPLTSHPIARDLGLTAPGGLVSAPVGFQCKVGFELQPGTVLHP